MASTGVPVPSLSINDPAFKANLVGWINAGCVCKSKKLFQRPSAIADPNTFVFMWCGVTLAPYGEFEYVALDAHYQGSFIQKGKPPKALGGMWIKGVSGDLKPEQDAIMKPKLIALLPSVSPDPAALQKFGKY